jgi:4-oxalocrotonate tautomerase
MPHISIKLANGKTEEQKTRLVEAIVQDVMNVLNSKEENVSVAIEEIQPKDWTEKVYRPDSHNKWDQLYKKPGYNPLEK